MRTMGVEVATAGSTAVFFELDLDVALNKNKAPLTPAEIVRPAIPTRPTRPTRPTSH